MSIVTFKDFTIENITDRVHEVNEFQGRLRLIFQLRLEIKRLI